MGAKVDGTPISECPELLLTEVAGEGGPDLAPQNFLSSQ